MHGSFLGLSFTFSFIEAIHTQRKPHNFGNKTSPKICTTTNSELLTPLRSVLSNLVFACAASLQLRSRAAPLRAVTMAIRTGLRATRMNASSIILCAAMLLVAGADQPQPLSQNHASVRVCNFRRIKTGKKEHVRANTSRSQLRKPGRKASGSNSVACRRLVSTLL